MRFTVIFLSDFLSDFLTFSATFFVCVTPANMSDYTQLIHNIVLSVQNTPFLFDLIDDPIRVNSEDIFDVTSFIEDLVQTFDKLSLCVDPLEIIQIYSGIPKVANFDNIKNFDLLKIHITSEKIENVKFKVIGIRGI